MPYFKWVGVDIIGQIKKGRLAAHSSDELSERLLQRGVALLRCTSLYTVPFVWKLTLSIKAQVFSSIARLLRAGIMMPDVFVITAQQVNNPFLYDALFNWAMDIKSGESFVATVKKQSQLCDPLVITMLVVGNESGNMMQAVENVVSYYQMRHDFKKGIRASLAMPLLTFVFFIGITLLIFLFIMPRFADMFLSMNSELPPLTRYMIDISSFVSSWSMVQLLLITFVSGVGVYHCCKKKAAYAWDMLCIRMPFIGRVIWYHECGQFLYALSLLINNNVPLLQALEILESSIHNHGVKYYINALYCDVQSGILLSQAMAGLLVFSSDVVALVKVGEESGTLGASLISAADLYRDSAQRLLGRFVFLIQPIVIIILGFLIGMLIFAVYLPIMNLSHSI